MASARFAPLPFDGDDADLASVPLTPIKHERRDDPHTQRRKNVPFTKSRNEESSLHPPSGEIGSAHSSTSVLANTGSQQIYTFQRYLRRSLLNVFLPVVVFIFYVFIILHYFLRPSVNDIIPGYVVNARIIFFTWIILSVFILEWAKSGIAGFEATALMKPSLAPSNAAQLLWHADRAWGAISGWWRALRAVNRYVWTSRLNAPREWDGPGGLWWYLAFSSFLLYVAVPLGGISMDITRSFTITDRRITIMGPNETNFDLQNSNLLAARANERWRQGNPTTPQGATIFYAPSHIQNASETFYQDSIQDIYERDTQNRTLPDRKVTMFTGPQVGERAHGNVWGLETTISCQSVDMFSGLELLNISSIDVWEVNTTSYIRSDSYGSNATRFDQNAYYLARSMASSQPLSFEFGTSYGTTFRYLIAGDRDLIGSYEGEYRNASTLPIEGALEVVLWQSPTEGYEADVIFEQLPGHPVVVSNVSVKDNQTYLGFAVRCEVNSTTGYADLDSVHRTYSAFTKSVSQGARTSIGAIDSLFSYPGVSAIQSIVLAALSSLTFTYVGAPMCSFPACGLMTGVNLATGVAPIFQLFPESDAFGLLQYPSITPERLTYAMYKIFGESAISIMSTGTGNWTGNLTGLRLTDEVVPGRVPWQMVLGILGAWLVITIVPSVWTFPDRRWTSSFDGTAIFRLGAEWRHQVHRFEGNDYLQNPALRSIPGLVGDMEPSSSATGFVGLSDRSADARRQYTYNRSDLPTKLNGQGV